MTCISRALYSIYDDHYLLQPLQSFRQIYATNEMLSLTHSTFNNAAPNQFSAKNVHVRTIRPLWSTFYCVGIL